MARPGPAPPLEFYDPFFEAGVIDVIQHDMKGLGVTGLATTRWYGSCPTMSNVHHITGGLCSASSSASNSQRRFRIFSTAKSRLSPAISLIRQATNSTMARSQYRIPPGLGLELNQDVYDARYAGKEDWQIS